MELKIELDERYTIQLEGTGALMAQWVVRFCGEWVGSSPGESGASALGIEHAIARDLILNGTSPSIVSGNVGLHATLLGAPFYVQYGCEYHKFDDLLEAVNEFNGCVFHDKECNPVEE